MAKSKSFELTEVQSAYLEKLKDLTNAEGHKSKPTEYWKEIVPHSFDSIRDRFDHLCEVIDYCSTKLESNDLTSFEIKFFTKELENEKHTLNYLENSAFKSIQNDIQNELTDCKDIPYRIEYQQGKFKKFLEKIEVLSGIPFQTGGGEVNA
tara:strand:+ start:120 stop:572 length:453 start_codon:yes stop_codon:yes gene_type:complete